MQADGRVPKERQDLLADTPEEFGDVGHWRYHMPNNDLELHWQGYDVTPDENRLRGRQEAAERVLQAAVPQPWPSSRERTAEPGAR
jgi:hypothetical protein